MCLRLKFFLPGECKNEESFGFGAVVGIQLQFVCSTASAKFHERHLEEKDNRQDSRDQRQTRQAGAGDRSATTADSTTPPGAAKPRPSRAAITAAPRPEPECCYSSFEEAGCSG